MAKVHSHTYDWFSTVVPHDNPLLSRGLSTTMQNALLKANMAVHGPEDRTNYITPTLTKSLIKHAIMNFERAAYDMLRGRESRYKNTQDVPDCVVRELVMKSIEGWIAVLRSSNSNPEGAVWESMQTVDPCFITRYKKLVRLFCDLSRDRNCVSTQCDLAYLAREMAFVYDVPTLNLSRRQFAERRRTLAPGPAKILKKTKTQTVKWARLLESELNVQ